MGNSARKRHGAEVHNAKCATGSSKPLPPPVFVNVGTIGHVDHGRSTFATVAGKALITYSPRWRR
jgi:GTPase